MRSVLLHLLRSWLRGQPPPMFRYPGSVFSSSRRTSSRAAAMRRSCSPNVMHRRALTPRRLRRPPRLGPPAQSRLPPVLARLWALSLAARRLHHREGGLRADAVVQTRMTTRAFASVGTTSGSGGRGRRCRRRRTRSEHNVGRVCTDGEIDRADVRDQHRRGPHVLVCQRRSW